MTVIGEFHGRSGLEGGEKEEESKVLEQGGELGGRKGMSTLKARHGLEERV
jgi:hypothetical protein